MFIHFQHVQETSECIPMLPDPSFMLMVKAPQCLLLLFRIPGRCEKDTDAMIADAENKQDRKFKMIAAKLVYQKKDLDIRPSKECMESKIHHRMVLH